MHYRWIHVHEIPPITNQRIVLFGAGAGTDEFISFLKAGFDSAAHIVGIADNDSSLHGKRVYGYDVIAPKSLQNITFDMIIVTSISGREAISTQLTTMGYEKNRDFFTIGKYPTPFRPAIKLFRSYFLNRHPEAVHGACLHIGPGGNFGLDMLLYAYGFDRVTVIDKYGFGEHYPDVTDDRDTLEGVRAYLEAEPDKVLKHGALERLTSLIRRKNLRLVLDENVIRFFCPMDVCDMAFPDHQFDVVFSSGVLEHAADPEAAVREIVRVLKPGGTALHKVITRDHRAFSAWSGFHPFSFRTYSCREWEDLAADKFYQNRTLPVEWKHLFETHGLTVDVFAVFEHMAIDDEMLNQFHPDFHQFARADLEAIDCVIMGHG